MLLVGVDDTDSRMGGCTTTFADIIRAEFEHLPPAGPPRLVRLNPNVPWKTRGNGAVALGFTGDHDLDDALERVVRLVKARSRREVGTDPGVVVARRAPSPAFYGEAVRTVVTFEAALAHVAHIGGRAWGGRGVIGATAALAWPAERTTWERIAYRAPDRIGTPRDVDADRLRTLETNEPTLFDTYDLIEDDVVCVPSSPCPVLWGLRGEDPSALERASQMLGPERPVAETLFLTNHATDDHLAPGTTADARACESLRVRGRVVVAPEWRGGHVFVRLADDAGTLRAASYAPTRGFRHLVGALVVGDELTLAGGIQVGPDGALTLGIEKLCIHALAPRKGRNPRCACGKAMKSIGRDAGYRCRACGGRASHADTSTAGIALGWHEVPSSARRHLASPLRRMLVAPSA